MKLKKLLAAVICIILSLCMFAGGCALSGGSGDKGGNDNKKPPVEQPDDEDEGVYTITFDAGEHGTLTQTTLTTDLGTLYSLPVPVAEEGYTFVGWYTAETGGERVVAGYEFTDDTTLYARYKAPITVPDPEPETPKPVEYTVTFNAGKLGTLSGAKTQKTVNGKIAVLPTPTVGKNCTFLGWYTKEEGGDRVTTANVYVKNTTLYAHYKQTAEGADTSKFLTTDGRDVKTSDGETVYLRGVNAGGLFVTEEWMTGVKGKDYKTITKTFIERFGEEKTKELWAEYRANWWTDKDFENCVDMGMNVIRVPFTYMNVDFGAISNYDNAGNYDFAALDAFVTKAASYGLYTILDLHGAYGSQNGQDHSGEEISVGKDENPLDYVDFYSNERMKTLTVNLWDALSEHYKDNPAVAGYDILNEPGEKAMTINETHWAVYDNIYDTIRANGDNHIILFESCWEWWNLPEPAQYGWENCMYSFHHYAENDGTVLSVQDFMNNWRGKLSGIEDAYNSRNYNVPLQMGEFTAYDFAEKWEQTLALLKEHNWHYTSWTYKTCMQSGWGIYNVSGSDKADPSKDSYNDIINKFKKLNTANATRYTFGNGKMLSSLFKYSLKGETDPVIAINKIGLTQDNGKAYALFSGTCTVNERDELLSYVIDGEINSRKKLTLEIVSYDENSGAFVLRADLSVFNQNGRYYMHAGFDNAPANMSRDAVQIDETNPSVSVGGKTYSLGEEWGTRQIIVS